MWVKVLTHIPGSDFKKCQDVMGTVMNQGNGESTWVFILRELDSERTRLIARWRMRWNPTFKTPALVLIRLLLV